MKMFEQTLYRAHTMRWEAYEGVDNKVAIHLTYHVTRENARQAIILGRLRLDIKAELIDA